MKRMKQKGIVSRTMSWILSAALVFSTCSVTAQAEEEPQDDVVTEKQSEQESSDEEKNSEETSSSKEEQDSAAKETSSSEKESESTKETSSSEKESESAEETSSSEKETESTEEETETTEETSSTEEEQDSAAEETEESETETVSEEFAEIALQSIALFSTIGNVTETCPTIGEGGKVTFHYYPQDGEQVTSAYVKGSWSGDWSEYFYMKEDEDGVWSVTAELSLEKSYEYGFVVNDNWVNGGDPTNSSSGNSKIFRNPYYNSDGSVTIFYYPQGDESVQLLYKGTDDSSYTSIEMTKDSVNTALLSATVSEQGDYTYMLEVDGSRISDVNCKEAAFSITKLPEDDASVKSPVVNGNKVTFNYFEPTAKSVALAGEMNDWGKTATTALTYNAETGFWSTTQELTPGKYEYKFVIDGGNWVIDPRNDAQSNNNSVFFVSGLKGASIDAEAGTTVSLPETLQLYGAEGTASDITPEYTMEEQYQEILTMKDGSISIPSDFTAESFQVIASYEDYTAEITVNMQTNIYRYTIYYLDDSHQDVNSASLWVWSDGVNGTQYFFNSTEELSDGNVWLKAEVSVPFDSLYVIPKAYDGWAWQDADKSFENVSLDKNVTLYLVNGDATAYTSIPDVAAKEKRYVIIEYNRPGKDYEGWNIYSWNTGYGSEVTVDFQEIGGKMAALVPVTDTKESISFCMRRSDDSDKWAEKDGGDHTVAIPLDQRVVKASFEQGTGVTGNLPYNIGYVTDTAAGEITFYYRDDALYQNYEEESLDGKVRLVWDGKEYAMSYDAANERYFYTGSLEEGKHYYGYLVNGELLTDRFQQETMTVGDVTYSAYEYIAFEAQLKAVVTPDTFDYNDNAVLKLSLENADAEEGADIQAAEAYADLSALGLSSHFEIDTALMEGTIAVQENIASGKKEIPVTVKDQYGNLYETTANVTVAPRQSGDDFDWDEAVIYFAVTDRFFDGNSSNNDAYGTGTYAPAEGSMYHGGDFAGLEAKLDYLQDLGVNTIWITPVVENIEDVLNCDGYEGQHNSGYHGYWASDFTKLNQHLGTEEEFSALIQAMHARGMKIMVDVVLNHAGYGTEDKYQNTYLPGKNMLRDKTTTVQGDDKKDALSSLPDFVTEDREVSDLLIAWQTSWVTKYDIDYFRVDTVKHVDDTTWKAFKNALTYADPDFKMIGEYAGGGYATNAGQLGTGQMDSLLDFDFNDQALAFVNGSLSSVENFLEARNAGINNTATMGSFLSSHDEDGLMYRMMQESGKFSEDKAHDLMKVAAALQITAKGQPVIYYGEELGQTGANNWPYQTNRYDMDWASANAENDMLAHYTTLLKIRNEYTDVFAKGTRSTVKLDEENGVLVMSRSYGGSTLYVGFNINQMQEKEVELSLTVNTTYTDLYSGNTYKTDADGNVVVAIPAAQDGGTVILKAGKSASSNTTTDTNPNASSDSESSAAAAPVKTVQQPTYTKADGTVVSGWSNVISTSISEAEAKRVLTAEMQTPMVIDIMAEENVLKVIPAAEVKKMDVSGADFRFHFGNRMVMVYNHESLSTINGDLDLNFTMTTDKDFGQGFKAIVFEPRKRAGYGGQLSFAYLIGKEHAGKTAFLFSRNIATDQVELFTACVISEDGTIVVSGTDYTDFIILY